MYQMIWPDLEGLQREDFDAATEQVQGLRLMKFEEVYERTTARRLSQHEAASILGVSERTFRR